MQGILGAAVGASGTPKGAKEALKVCVCVCGWVQPGAWEAGGAVLEI